MNKNLILIAAAAAGAFLLLKQARPATGPRVGTTTANPVASKNVNSDMWSLLLGNGWRNLVSAQNPDGSGAFLMKNAYGQTVTSDGTPVSTGDPVNDYLQTSLGFPPTEPTFAVGEMIGGYNPTGDPMNGFRNPFDFYPGD